MNEAIKKFENKAYRSFWNDGLLDLMCGLAILMIGVSWWQHLVALGAIFPAICVSLWYPLRARLVEPRMGYVEFTGARELKVRTFRFGLVAFFVGTMLLGAVVFMFARGGTSSLPIVWVAGLPLSLIAIPILFFGLFTNCKRFFAYAVLLLLAGVGTVFSGSEPHVGMITCGFLIAVAGLVTLFRFLSRYPAQPPEAT